MQAEFTRLKKCAEKQKWRNNKEKVESVSHNITTFLRNMLFKKFLQ